MQIARERATAMGSVNRWEWDSELKSDCQMGCDSERDFGSESRFGSERDSGSEKDCAMPMASEPL
jgi:hypothetical protein